MFFERLIGALFFTAAILPSAGCLSTHHTVDANVQPIHVTLDVNLRVEKELDSFFGELDKENPLLKEGADQNAESGDPANPSAPSAKNAPNNNKDIPLS